MQLSVIGGKTIDVADSVFAAEFNEGLVHQVLTCYRSASRQGTKAQKTRSQVSGGGKKPWRQKGTGRARAGSTRSPLWRSGGVIFAATPKDYSKLKKVNKKMYARAMQSILSQLVREERLHVASEFNVAEAKTKVATAELKKLNIEQEKTLIVVSDIDTNTVLALRNLHWVKYITVAEFNPLDPMVADKVVMTEAALKQLEERLA